MGGIDVGMGTVDDIATIVTVEFCSKNIVREFNSCQQ